MLLFVTYLIPIAFHQREIYPGVPDRWNVFSVLHCLSQVFKMNVFVFLFNWDRLQRNHTGHCHLLCLGSHLLPWTPQVTLLSFLLKKSSKYSIYAESAFPGTVKSSFLVSYPYVSGTCLRPLFADIVWGITKLHLCMWQLRFVNKRGKRASILALLRLSRELVKAHQALEQIWCLFFFFCMQVMTWVYLYINFIVIYIKNYIYTIY